jgi:arylsulfatase B
MKYFLSLLGLVFLLGCADDDQMGEPQPSTVPNILLIIADDMGKDATAGFTEGTLKPTTPHLDNLREEGLVFTNCWVYPTCSPTRASIITGKYGYRTGVKWANDILDPSETILQRYINDQTDDAYATAVVGKWHLAGESTSFNPESLGIDYYAGLIRGAVQSYYQWQLTEDGVGSLQTDYTTEVFTDLAIDWVNEQNQPWFLWLAYTAPHTPFHVPPAEMHSQGDLPEYAMGMDPMPYYLAAIEAMDYQIGRLLAAIPEEELDNTVVLFLGDNGTPNQVAQGPYTSNTVKGTLYQGGINVPMYIAGKGVSRTGMENSLVGSTDLFCTIAELAGVTVPEVHDSKSFKGLLSATGTHRNFQYSEMNDGTQDLWTISNGEYKLIVSADGSEEMYHLGSDPYETTDLLDGSLTVAEENAKLELEAELATIRD